MKKIVYLISILPFLFCLGSCDKPTSPDNIPFTVNLKGDTTIILLVNDTFKIRISPMDASVKYTINVDQLYKTPQQGVITVSADGRVKAIEAGKVVLSVKNNTGQSNFTVVVVAVPASILLKDSSILIKTGRNSQLTLAPEYDQYEQKILGDVIWETSDNNIATVSVSGEISALKEGETKLKMHLKNFPQVQSGYTVRVVDYFVYVLGNCSNDQTSVRNCYWKNGIAVVNDLYKTSFVATAIQYSGNSIYIAGISKVPIRAYMLKDKTETLFDEPGAGAWAITVVGDDVYTTGYYTVAGIKTVALWKNKTLIPIIAPADINTESIGLSIAYSSGDTYVGGYIINNQNKQVACYWKNKQRVDLSDGTAYGIVNSVFVDGTDIYASGSCAGTIPSMGNGYRLACYWKNGVKTDLISAISDGRSIAISKGDIYVAGNYLNNDVSYACYWKNGSKVDLAGPAGTIFSNISAMKIADNNVFISGYYLTAMDKPMGCYWKNGNRVDLEPVKFMNGTAVEIYKSINNNDIAIE